MYDIIDKSIEEVTMPSFNIHLAVAVKYCEKNNIKNKNDFFMGSIAPDLVEDKSQTHYTGFRDKKFLKEFLFQKVRLNEFAKNEKLDSDYQYGVFLHLATDFMFFNDLLDSNYIENSTHDDFTQDLYYSYNLTNSYLEEKYNIHELNLDDIMNNNIKNTLKKNNIDNTKGANILPKDKLENFIERLSNLDVEKYFEKVKKEDRNVFP